MDWEKLREELNLAIDESELIGIELDPLGRGVGLTLSVLSLPVEGPPPEDRRVQVLLFPVGRVAASLKLNDTIEDILISLERQYHLIRPLERNDKLFLYVVLDRAKSNLAMSRHELKSFEKNLEFS